MSVQTKARVCPHDCHLKFFIARLVAEAPVNPASAQIARLMTEKMPKV